MTPSARKIFLLPVYIKLSLNMPKQKMKLVEGGMELRLSIILVLALMLSASTACAFGGPGSVVVDIVGSVTDNTKITSYGMEKVELEIIGSQASNTTISPPAETEVICPDCPCPECDDEEESYPWEGRHLGVDAWYDTFWYTNINLPKWPQF
jgi:hypothetical protein